MSPTTKGIVAGRVVEIRSHPHADRIRIAIVDVNRERPLQIVFGGPPVVTPGCIVPVAPPGSRLGPRHKKMRRRKYRRVSSEGMLCSLAELGWDADGPDEVTILEGLEPGAPIDDLADGEWRAYVSPSHRSNGEPRAKSSAG
jgi:phenylalanyl-tRNA synthetase beta chain